MFDASAGVRLTGVLKACGHCGIELVPSAGARGGTSPAGPQAEADSPGGPRRCDGYGDREPVVRLPTDCRDVSPGRQPGDGPSSVSGDEAARAVADGRNLHPHSRVRLAIRRDGDRLLFTLLAGLLPDQQLLRQRGAACTGSWPGGSRAAVRPLGKDSFPGDRQRPVVHRPTVLPT
jgi:hypothetical protein